MFHDSRLLPSTRRRLHRTPRRPRPAESRPRARLKIQSAAHEDHEYGNGEWWGMYSGGSREIPLEIRY